MYGNIAVSLTSIVGFPLKEKDTLTVRVEAKEISEMHLSSILICSDNT